MFHFHDLNSKEEVQLSHHRHLKFFLHRTGGWSTYISSSMYPLRKAFFTSIWNNLKSIIHAKASSGLMASNLAIGA